MTQLHTTKREREEHVAAARKSLYIHLIIFFVGATLFLLLSPQQVSSLGVAPSLFNLDNPDEVIELRLRILNSQHEDLFVVVQPVGDLADYVDLEQTSYRIRTDQEEQIVNYRLSIPDSLPPGQNVLNMYVKQVDEYVEGSVVDAAQLNAKISVVQRVNVNIPYPGEYLTGNLFVQATRTKEPIKFIVHAINKGDQDVKYSGKITIRGPTNQILGTVQIPSSSVQAASDQKMNLELAGLTNAGEYVAEAHIQYGDQQLIFRKPFTVGSMKADAYEMRIDRFRLGEIVKVIIGLSSEWNQQIEDLFVEGKVINTAGVVVSTFTSNTLSIPPQGLAELEAYWDTADLAPGTYDFDLQLHYGNQITENYFEGALSLDQAVFTERGITGNVISSRQNDSVGESSSHDLLKFLVFLVIILVVLNALWLFKFRKKKRGK